ncbi:hypothetical protein ACWDWU_17195 [Streptomyces sp. NPDC003442]
MPTAWVETGKRVGVAQERGKDGKQLGEPVAGEEGQSAALIAALTPSTVGASSAP